ncbi:MAG: 2-succinyl-5-enolpyruvyl-6-hydroxy-3-cyclohexene-1-carboxylic-acid synthase [Bacteroidales bacterium]|jgi:2-succinyl-5-enolpyruvyl-6-hydroxy-3-cyclohexene-1-carboxylate synthase|nr:2-succinyl-5-enolpyruvyl-6-hydroxy-3-cyclohexene-1-carboxylic-acid synthase [Bacteroidales bacterium]
MISTKQEVQILAALMLEKGITDVVVSPGSRNAPLINTFAALPDFRCFNIVDERSAAFFAMGLALRLGRPVAVCCTSGSAMLNYAPAVAEAFYQKIPLVVLSADRPKEWVDQGDGQTIRQDNALTHLVKKSVSLSGGMRDEAELWYNTRLINEVLNAATDVENGPVHLNLPFAEPLYDTVDSDLPGVKSIVMNRGLAQVDVTMLAELQEEWEGADKKLIIVGQMQPDANLEGLLNHLANDNTVVVLSEKTSNLKGENILDAIDNLLFANDEASLAPDLLITLGGQIVSKKVKSWLRHHKPQGHWHFSPSAEVQDTFMSLTRVVSISPLSVLLNLSSTSNSEYSQRWLALNGAVETLHKDYVARLDFCDFTVFDTVIKHLPKEAVLHLSNSTPVRYAQLFPMQELVYQSNRGTSGIDGVISTAAGYAHDDERLNILVIGDLSFFYDSNALWNKHFPKNLKIVLINNGGGGIFRFIDGPSRMKASTEHFVAQHQTQAEGIVTSYGIDYSAAFNQKEFELGFQNLLEKDKAAVLEVNTPAEKNAEVLRGYFNYLKHNV